MFIFFLSVPLIAKGVYTFDDLKAACEPCRTHYLTKTLAEIFKQLTKEKVIVEFCCKLMLKLILFYK